MILQATGGRMFDRKEMLNPIGVSINTERLMEVALDLFMYSQIAPPMC